MKMLRRCVQGSLISRNGNALLDAVKECIAQLRAADPGNTQPIPVDLGDRIGRGAAVGGVRRPRVNVLMLDLDLDRAQ